LQAEDATTPLRQLYFIVQVMVMSPNDKESAMPLFRESLPSLITAFSNQKILSELKHVDRLVTEEKYLRGAQDDPRPLCGRGSHPRRTPGSRGVGRRTHTFEGGKRGIRS
jgi:hypothetical protein